MADYEFKYSPLTGRLTGKQMIEQTEQAINALASQVDSAAGQVEIISTLANEANENAATALETAEEALATTGRTYITVSTQTDANDYYDSELIYIADSTSTNIPVEDTGMLEVKTNDNKTACEQCFVADSSGASYYRHGDITAETVGDVTTYTVTWGGWSSEPASQTYVQGELANYLPFAGGTMTGKISYNGSNSETFSLGLSSTTNIDIGWSYSNSNGALLALRGNSDINSGNFELFARNASNTVSLLGTPNGVLAWGGNRVQTAKHYSTTVTVASGFTNYNSSYPLTAHRVGNVVQIYAILKSTSEKSDGEYTLFTLPSGYRPIDTIYQVAQGSSVNRWLLKITTGGVATIARYGTTSATSIANGAWLPFSVTFITTNSYPS